MYEGKTRITYYDLDFKGNMKLSAILRMVHIAADVNANELGIGFSTLHPLNISFVLQRFGLKINRMPVYDEVVTVRTWPAERSHGAFIRKGDMYDASGEKIMEWASLWILFDVVIRRILKPSALPIDIPTITNVDVGVKPERIMLQDDCGGSFSEYTHIVRYAEVDTNMHMNNSIYGDLIGNAAFPCLNEGDYTNWKEVQINYLGETFPGEEIKITAYKNDDEILVKGMAVGRAAFAARILTH